MKIAIGSVLKCKVSTLGLLADDVISIGVWSNEIMILREKIYNPVKFLTSYVMTTQTGLTIMVSWYTANESTDHRLMERFDLIE